MVASGEKGYAKEWQDAVLEDAAAHAAEHGLDTPSGRRRCGGESQNGWRAASTR